MRSALETGGCLLAMIGRVVSALKTLDAVSIGVGAAVILLTILVDKLLKRAPVKAKQKQHIGHQSPCPRDTTPCLLEAMSLSKSQVVADRKTFFSTAQVLSHSRVEPLLVLRGRKEFVYDEKGTEYLDSRNNVPILGHADERIVRDCLASLRNFCDTLTRCEL
jgi:hypothetical protein